MNDTLCKKNPIRTEFSGLLPYHTAQHYLELGTHLSMTLQENTLSDKIAGPGTDEPNSQTSHSTSPHCPMACTVQSMTWDTPV